jgi:hypothetical protein
MPIGRNARSGIWLFILHERRGEYLQHVTAAIRRPSFSQRPMQIDVSDYRRRLPLGCSNDALLGGGVYPGRLCDNRHRTVRAR